MWRRLCLCPYLRLGQSNRGIQIEFSFQLFGRHFALPVFAAPIGAMQLHYGDKYDDLTYSKILVSACREAGIAAFTGDGVDPAVLEGGASAVAGNNGHGVLTIKPWDENTLKEKMKLVETANPFAVAMDIDAAGLPFLKNLTPPAGSKTVEELREIAELAGVPFILKGIMTVQGAKKSLEAGASGIVVSNHGGRVLSQCPATAEVRRADRTSLCQYGVRRRRAGRERIRGKTPDGAERYDGNVRRPFFGGDRTFYG